MEAERLTIATCTTGPCVVLTFDGELDVTNAEKAEETVLACVDVRDRMIFDLSGLGFMDSTGVRVLVRARRWLLERSGTLALAGLTPSVSRIMHVTGLHRAFAIHETLDQALADDSADELTVRSMRGSSYRPGRSAGGPDRKDS
jgi:anti-anti-sigma factor